MDPSKRRRGGCHPSAASDWSSVASDILINILGRLQSLQDFFAVRGVCREWRKVASPSQSTLSSQSPLLLVVGTKFEALFDLKTGLRYSNLQLPWSYPNRRTIAYSHGHLITQGRRNGRVRLWDLFTGATTTLPQHPKPFFQAILSHRPDSARCQVVLWDISEDELQYIDVGDTHWNIVSSPQLLHVKAMTFFQGKLVALTKDMELLSVELMGDSSTVHKLGGNGADGAMWLGESDGVLIAVWTNGSEGFKVFQWNSDDKGWDEMHEFGDKAFFACSHGFFASISSTTSGIRKNCVYYQNGGGNWREFSLQDASDIEVEYDYSHLDVRKRLSPSPVWIFASLC